MGIKEYGFSSKKPLSEANYFFNKLDELGINNIDAAPSYGNIEKEIGYFHVQNLKRFRIWTKVDGLEKNSQTNVDRIISSAKNSISKIHCKNLFCLYLHQNDLDIISDNYVRNGLRHIKENNLSTLTGVSIYSEEELRLSLTLDYVDVIQLPVSATNTYLYNVAKKNNINNK